MRNELEDIKTDRGSTDGQLEQAQVTISLLKRNEEDSRRKIEGYLAKIK